MKNFRNLFFLALTLCALAIPHTVSIADYDDVKPKKVTQITSSKTNIKVGDSFELRAKLSPTNADEDYLKWSIIGKTGIIAFDDDDNDDDEVEFKALKTGTTKVRCSIRGKGTKYSKTIKITVKKADNKISRISKKNIKVELGDDFDLKVQKSSGVKNRDLKWSIKDTSIVNFDDNDRYGDDIDLDAKKIGKTTVTCKNTKTNTTLKFTVEVIPDQDFDDDDDDDDYDD